MLLESFRHDPVGLPYINVFTPDKKIKRKLQAPYIDYTFRAFYLTMQDIEQLEYASGNLVPAGRNAIVAASLWFLALESYINTLLKITCIHLGQDFNAYKGDKVADKLTRLLHLLKFESTEVLALKKTGLHSRINEFTNFRNEIFHDRNTGKALTFHKTQFSSIPVNCNLVDILQGLSIFLETVSLLRYSVTGLDTMPDIFIHAHNKAFYKKLDYLFRVLVKPSFEGVLIKHGLGTRLSLDISFPTSQKSPVFFPGDVVVILATDSPRTFYYSLSETSSQICYTLFIQVVKGVSIGPESFQLPSY